MFARFNGAYFLFFETMKFVSYMHTHGIHADPSMTVSFGLINASITDSEPKSRCSSAVRSIFRAELGAVVFGVQRISEGESLRRFIGSC